MFRPRARARTQLGVGSTSISVVTLSGTVSGTAPTTPMLPIMVGLSLLDFNQLINDTIHNDDGWPYMPTKLPSDIPKFKGNAGEDSTNHV